MTVTLSCDLIDHEADPPVGAVTVSMGPNGRVERRIRKRTTTCVRCERPIEWGEDYRPETGWQYVWKHLPQDGDKILDAGGREIGFLVLGDNDRWFGVDLARLSWADPLEGMDNVHSFGADTAREAAQAFLRTATR